MKNVISLCSSQIGSAHIKENIPCQDYAYTIRKNGCSCISVADGAGSAKKAETGARIVATVLTKYIAFHFYRILNLANRGQATKVLVEEARKAITKIMVEGDLMEDYNTTFMAIAVKDKQCIVVHIGDGLTGFEKDGKVGIITYPINGEYANTTYFITGDNAEYMMQCRTVELKSKSIRLFCLSDGSADLYYNSVFGLRNTNTLIYCFKEIMKCENQDERLGCLERLLGYISRRFTADDCSISVMLL